jgi:hypothetical protein
LWQLNKFQLIAFKKHHTEQLLYDVFFSAGKPGSEALLYKKRTGKEA